ncbi:isoprenylcysteine carboxylmethyltransferase family protein [Kordiimonas sp. SCSIO 12610]|uniref:methyltransferase family protein n=1 Tax=Kordiimonas sp. SCSIO 12610 TaxID=2829597 RepID=UPI00210A52AC|nr:isoprenylcysteine carboxylmethyltransferase family protein [Kordiimonas sp. SCSIO 12610]UTW53894.1 isoprenylcysteine carboxylmethyltransferase family protein [Kordiimonas sp. SCSIO 12610]
MKNKVPPPFVMIFFGVFILLSKRILPEFDFGFVGDLGFVFYPAAALLIASAVLSFKRHETTVNPLEPESASNLVTSGVFRISRNPMYLAMAFILIGLSLHKNAISGFVFVPSFIAYITKFQILPEEAAMHKLFGDDYSHYKARVRRWI